MTLNSGKSFKTYMDALVSNMTSEHNEHNNNLKLYMATIPSAQRNKMNVSNKKVKKETVNTDELDDTN